MLETKEVIGQVRNIEIATKDLVDGLIAGNYHSIFKGQGIEFSEIREYRPGDDVRAIDWKVTARFNHPFIKEFIEERDLRVFFVFDYSASGSFGNTVEKRRKAIELTATLMFSAMRNNDNVGMFIFTDGVEKYVPARKGRRHVLKIISSLVTHTPEFKTTNIHKTLTYVANVLKKKSIIFVVSDFSADNFSTPLAILNRRHDVIALRVSDSREKSLPDVGLIELEDEETGEQLLVDTSDPVFRGKYEEHMSSVDSALHTMFKKNKIDSVEFLTDKPYDVPLRKFFKTRLKRAVS